MIRVHCDGCDSIMEKSTIPVAGGRPPTRRASIEKLNIAVSFLVTLKSTDIEGKPVPADVCSNCLGQLITKASSATASPGDTAVPN